MWEVTLGQLQDAAATYGRRITMLHERESFSHFRQDGPIPILDILKFHGIDDAIWATRCVPCHERDLRLFAVWMARQIQHLMPDARSLAALNIAERFANGLATESELTDARCDAWVAQGDIDRAGIGWEISAAANAAGRVAIRVACDAARDVGMLARYAAPHNVVAQKEMFIKMCQGEAPWQ